MTLDRILQSQGFGSRRECRQRILAGTVQVNDQPCRDPAAAFPLTGLHFTVEGERWTYRAQVYLALYKPLGYECSQAPQQYRSVYALLPAALRQRGVQAIGRLDQDTSGLLLLTDDGACNHALSSPRRHVPKTYLATTRHPITPELMQALQSGVLLHGETETLAAENLLLCDAHRLQLSIRQGKYHQVKRMIAAAGNRVDALHRSAVGSLCLDVPPLAALAPGEWCYLEAGPLALAGYELPGASTRISSPINHTT